MIYILSGIAKSGKTTLTKWIAKELSISVVSTDDIMMMLHHSKQLPKLDITLSDTSVSKDIEPYIKGLIQSWIENNKTYLLEGVHITTDFAASLVLQYPDDIQLVFLGYADVPVQQKVQELKIHSPNIPNQWYSYMNEEEFEHLISYMIEESKRLRQECQEKDLPYIEVYNLLEQKQTIMCTLFRKK